MTVEVSTIYLLDVATGESVEAELRDAIEQAQLDDWQTKWQPALFAVLQELARKGVPMAQWPQSWHWNWAQKTARVQGLLGFPRVQRRRSRRDAGPGAGRPDEVGPGTKPARQAARLPRLPRGGALEPAGAWVYAPPARRRYGARSRPRSP